jgi:hypothetical protein
MIRRDLWNQSGRANPGYQLGSTNMAAQRGWDPWKWSPKSNPALQKATDDDVLMEEQLRRHELATKLLTRENARKAKQESDMMEALLSNGGAVNLFDEPANEQEDMLQSIIQNDVDAGSRGFVIQVADARRRRKEGFENLNYDMRLRDQALDRSKFVDLRERSRRDQDLEEARLNQQGQYRNAMLMQRQRQMEMDYAKDGDQNYQREAKLALDLVKDGMNPDEVATMFQLRPRDQQMLFGYAGMIENEEAEATEPMLEYLNNAELGMRTPVQQDNPGWLRRMFGAKAPPPAPAGRAGMNPASGQEFDKLRLEAAKMGLVYDPNEGFMLPEYGDEEGGYPMPLDGMGNPMQGGPRQPQGQMGGKRATNPALPLITSKAQLQEMIRTGRLRRGDRFRTYGGSEKVVM